MMDSKNPSNKSNGNPLNPVEESDWYSNIVCGDGENNARLARVTNQPISPSLACSDNIWDTQSDDSTSPSKVTNLNEVKENIPDQDENPKNSHVGEKTPHTTSKNNEIEVFDVGQSHKKINTLKKQIAVSPKPIRVRNMPLPVLSWADSTELSLLMCYKEDIGLVERTPDLFRRHPNLNPRMRAILLEWLMEVCEVYKMKRVTYYLAIDYIDRFLSRTEVIPKNQLQLLGITCLFIAAKIEEIYPPKLSELAYVTDNACTESEMLEQEVLILSKLRWDVQPYTCTGWLTLYLQLSCSGTSVRETITQMSLLKQDDFIYPQFSPHMFMTASMLMDLCALDDGMLQFKYSVIAASVIYYVINREKALYVSGYSWDKIKDCVDWMHPFAVVVSRNLNIYPINVPINSIPQNCSSALRKVNPNIILEEDHINQNHKATLALLEEVQTEIKAQESYRKLEMKKSRPKFLWTEEEPNNNSDEEGASSNKKRGLKRQRSSSPKTPESVPSNSSPVQPNAKKLCPEKTYDPLSQIFEQPDIKPAPKKLKTNSKRTISESESSTYGSSDSESEVKCYDLSDNDDFIKQILEETICPSTSNQESSKSQENLNDVNYLAIQHMDVKPFILNKDWFY